MSNQGLAYDGADGDSAAISHVHNLIPTTVSEHDSTAPPSQALHKGTNRDSVDHAGANHVDVNHVNANYPDDDMPGDFIDDKTTSVSYVYGRTNAERSVSDLTENHMLPLSQDRGAIEHETRYMQREVGSQGGVNPYAMVNGHHETNGDRTTNGHRGAIEDSHVNEQSVDVEQQDVLRPPLQNGYHIPDFQNRHSDLFPGPSGTSVSSAQANHTRALEGLLDDVSHAIDTNNNNGNVVDDAEASSITAFSEHRTSPHPAGLVGGYDPNVNQTGVGGSTHSPDGEQPLFLARNLSALYLVYAQREAAGRDV